jgi:hypothetical protein
VRFLIAENFWADWEPYQSTAQSQARLEEQIYDYLVQFPTGDLSAPEPMLAPRSTLVANSRTSCVTWPSSVTRRRQAVSCA